MGLFDKLKFWKKDDTGINFQQPPLGIDTPNFSSNMMSKEENTYGMPQTNVHGGTPPFDAEDGNMDSMSVLQPHRSDSNSDFSEQDYGHDDSGFKQHSQNMNMQKSSNSANSGSGYDSNQEQIFSQNPNSGNYGQQQQATRKELVSHFNDEYNVKNGSQLHPQNMQNQSARDYALEKNIELISVKLDSLKIAMESINHRLSNIERVAYQQQDQQQKSGRKSDW